MRHNFRNQKVRWMKYLKTEHDYRDGKMGKNACGGNAASFKSKTLHLGEEIFGNLFSENSGNYER